MRDKFVVCVVLVLGLCMCAQAGRDEGDPWATGDGRICTYDGCNTACCNSDGACTQTMRHCPLPNRKQEFDEEYQRLIDKQEAEL